MRTLLTADRVVGSTRGECAVLVEEERILEVLDAREAASVTADQRIELPGATLLAGLIDAHVHLTMSAADSHAGVWRTLQTEQQADTLAARVRDNARAALRAGITLLRDLGDVQGVTLEVRERSRHDRDEQRQACSYLSDLLLAGPPITSPGGHLNRMGLIARGPDQTRAAAAHLISLGVDVVKVMASGGSMTPESDPLRPQFSVDELRSIVEVAHSAGIPVTAHALCAESIRAAVKAGVDSLEHALLRGPDGNDVWDDRLVEQMARQGVWVTATLGGYLRRALPETALTSPGPGPSIKSDSGTCADISAMGGYDASGKASGAGASASAVQQPDLAAFWAPYARLRSAGVRVVAASDAGVRLTPIETPAEMLALLVHGFGLSGTDALGLLTCEPADALGLIDRGRLEAGALADLIAVDGDPTVEPAALDRVLMVMQAGAVAHDNRSAESTRADGWDARE